MSTYTNVPILQLPGSLPIYVPINTDTLGTGTTATNKSNVFTQILGAVPAILGALFPGGVGKQTQGGTTYTPLPTDTQPASILSPTLLIALAALVLVLVVPSKGKR